MENIFGIRHLSPASAYHLKHFLEQKKPRFVLIEGPSDCNDMIEDIVQNDLIPPFAMMSYTIDTPIQSLLYPFANYSPEYVAMKWAYQHHIPCAFMDLPSSAFLTMEESQLQQDKVIDLDMDVNDQWERIFEHVDDTFQFKEAVTLFAHHLRELNPPDGQTCLREAYMKTTIEKIKETGLLEDDIVVVCGAFHIEGIQQATCLSDNEYQKINQKLVNRTLMPYSYFRLSSLSGYGAGNKAPAYYELLWQHMLENQPKQAAYDYLSRISLYQREHGYNCSTAQVIEALQLAQMLAAMHQETLPSLQDLKDAAIACMGQGSESQLMEAFIANDIGTTMGYLPKGMSKTAIQNDFYSQLKQLKLERFQTIVATPLELDLRENTTVKSKNSAFLDLHRSCFLHQLRFLEIPFCALLPSKQDTADWKETWELKWSSEAEIILIENSLYGESIAYATQFCIKQKLEQSTNMSECAFLMEEAFLCGLPDSLLHALQAVQSLAIDSSSFEDIVSTAKRLSRIMRFGTLRHSANENIEPLFHQLFYRTLLLCVESCQCDDKVAHTIMEAMKTMNDLSIQHDHYMEEEWLQVLVELIHRDDMNPFLSGYATAILLERGFLQENDFQQILTYHISQGIPVDIAANWFEGFMMRNHYALIARSFVWKQLDEYIQDLEEQDFLRALLYLRRAFGTYSAKEKHDIAKNLGSLWHLDENSVAEVLNGDLKKEEQDLLDELEDFDFGDF